jgi:hypothetical protein
VTVQNAASLLVSLAICIAGTLMLPRLWTAPLGRRPAPGLGPFLRVAPLSVVAAWVLTAGWVLTLLPRTALVMTIEVVDAGVLVVVFLLWISVWAIGRPRRVIPPDLRGPRAKVG